MAWSLATYLADCVRTYIKKQLHKLGYRLIKMTASSSNRQLASRPKMPAFDGDGALDSLLFTLPAELREMIYHKVLPEEKQIQIRFCFDNSPSYSYANYKGDYSRRCGLIATSHRIRDETLPIFLSVNKFWCMEPEVTKFCFHGLAAGNYLSCLTRIQVFDRDRCVLLSVSRTDANCLIQNLWPQCLREVQ
jgi:hypothetical protein